MKFYLSLEICEFIFQFNYYQTLLNYIMTHITRMHFDDIRPFLLFLGIDSKVSVSILFSKYFFWPIFITVIKNNPFGNTLKHVETY